MIVYRENPQRFNKQLVESINELSKVNIQNSVAFSFISNKQLENEILNRISFTMTKIHNKFNKRHKTCTLKTITKWTDVRELEDLIMLICPFFSYCSVDSTLY